MATEALPEVTSANLGYTDTAPSIDLTNLNSGAPLSDSSSAVFYNTVINTGGGESATVSGDAYTVKGDGWNYGPLSDSSRYVQQSDGSGGIYLDPTSNTWIDTETNDAYGGTAAPSNWADSFLSGLSKVFTTVGGAMTNDKTGNPNLLGQAAIAAILGGISNAGNYENQKELLKMKNDMDIAQYDHKVATRGNVGTVQSTGYSDKLLQDALKKRSVREGGGNTGLLAATLNQQRTA